MPYHRKRKRRARLNTRGIVAALITGCVLLAAIIALIVIVLKNSGGNVKHPEKTMEPVTTSEGETIENTTEETTEALAADIQSVLDAARITAAQYDYDGAVEYVKTNIPDYENYETVVDFISECEANASKLVKWSDNTKITHIFFHTLIEDTGVAFFSVDSVKFNQVMTTIDEFNKIIQSMYDKGYVMVKLTDIATIDETTGQMTYNPIYLPEGKIPFVLSEDDVSYYEYMDDDGGFANRLVVTADGKIMNEKDNDDGTVTTGAFDVVPLIDEFLEEHPDFSYHGAKGYIALTGYNGILGYRTSYITYGNSEVLQQNYDGLFKNDGLFDEATAYNLAIGCHEKEMDPEQAQVANLEYNVEEIEAEREKAKAVADALKADGWLFASHTWGHMTMTDVVDKSTGTVTAERFYRDTQWWDYEVRPLIGDTDVIIFARGADIGSWRGYSDDNQAYMYLKSVGFDYYCNVDSSTYYVQLSKDVGGSGYLRQGRRNLDGTLMFKSLMYPEKELTQDLFDVAEVFDSSRPLPVEGVTLPDWYDGSTLIKPDWAIESDAAAASESAAAEESSQ